MDDDAIGGNQNKRSRQGHEIYSEEDDRTTNQRRRTNSEEDDRTTNQRRRTNQNQVEETQNDEDDLSLSLRPSSRVPPIVPPSLHHVRPPSSFAHPMTTWPSSDLMTLMTSSSPYHFMASTSYLPSSSSSSLSNSFLQSELILQPAPVNLVPARSGRSINPAAESRQSSNSNSSRNQRSETIPQPYPWATTQRGRIRSLEYLESKQITTITGDVQCKHCEKVYQVSYNLREKFSEVENVFVTLKRVMRERAPSMWTNPEPARCELCGREKAVKPVIAEKKSKINWLFLLLGQTLGYCTLEQLKNFCKHSKNHRTGAKDRVLYLTYLGLCKMLQPNRELFRCESSIIRR